MSAAGTELDLVQSATGHLLVTAPGLLCKRGQLLGANAVSVVLRGLGRRP